MLVTNFSRNAVLFLTKFKIYNTNDNWFILINVNIYIHFNILYKRTFHSLRTGIK